MFCVGSSLLSIALLGQQHSDPLWESPHRHADQALSSNMESNEQIAIKATIFSLFIAVSFYRLVSFILGQYPTVLRSHVLGRGKLLVVVIIVQCVLSMGVSTVFLVLYMMYRGLWGIYLLVFIVICTMLQEVIPRQGYMSND